MRKADQKQQLVLEQFFQKREPWYPDVWGMKFGAFFLLGISMILLIVPFQVLEKSDFGPWGMMYGLWLLGITLYLEQYRTYQEDGKKKSVYDRLRYLPVSYEQLCIFYLRKVMRLCAWLTGIVMFFQTMIAAVFLHTFSIGTILLPILAQFVIPVGVGWLRVVWAGRGKKGR